MKDLTPKEECLSIEALSALRAVLLFHSSSQWDEAKRHEWDECCVNCELLPDVSAYGITCRGKEATTKVLCDMVRSALGRTARQEGEDL